MYILRFLSQATIACMTNWPEFESGPPDPVHSIKTTVYLVTAPPKQHVHVHDFNKHKALYQVHALTLVSLVLA